MIFQSFRDFYSCSSALMRRNSDPGAMVDPVWFWMAVLTFKYYFSRMRALCSSAVWVVSKMNSGWCGQTSSQEHKIVIVSSNHDFLLKVLF